MVTRLQDAATDSSKISRKNTPASSNSRAVSNGQANSSYDASDIVTLEGLEAVRIRPGMYIGGTGSDGLMHLLWELIDNGVDEAGAGFATRIQVTLYVDGSVEVSDNGRGIPVDPHPTKKVSALEVVLTELHSGGKFGGEVYGASGGLHGVGASVVNALSVRVRAEVDRDGATWQLWFFKRKAGQFDGDRFRADHKLRRVRSTRKTGTRIRFWPDMDMFEAGATLDFEAIRTRAQQACFLVPGLRIQLEDKRRGGSNEPVELVSHGGLADLLNHLSDAETVTEVICIPGEETFAEKVPVAGVMTTVSRSCQVDIALRWVKGYGTQVVSFVNNIPTPHGGTHVAGFERALTRAVNDSLLSDSKKLTKLVKQGNDRAIRDDVQEGLIAAIKITVPEPQFRGQTKQELGTPAVQSIVYNVLKNGLESWFHTGPKSHVNALQSKIADAVMNRVTARQTLENKRRAASLGSAGMPNKLADCRVHGSESELILVEGDSAAGPAKAGRNAENMAILPLRGKVVNAAKSSVKQVLDNAEAQALFTAMGAGSGDDFDLSKARYGRIVILCDADVDGSHIRCLLLTLIHRFMHPMLEEGRVYAAQPPLYTAKVGDQTYRAFSDAERDQIVVEFSSRNRKAENIRWARFKGLGEMDTNELAECALDPATRTLRQLTLDDAKAAEEMFETLMGSDVGRRKDFLVNHSELVDRDALDY
ncbi:MAG: DNA topoisomerase IV subunit B [Acidimicrobiia bacterium]|nr:DNA topoisomerase IV subunit B [Acidimicrobiia bacterium]MYC57133.1 DNA topoisomerase IV subunit B [Acidimicrobiia bacterium]MYG94765.1 DNA topoisomerase IV subunit B [Acidimicrobiia bacterium]MYI30210.1 DNA topoisomerase IV subunit B [Acidimicrobiia bacterium]